MRSITIPKNKRWFGDFSPVTDFNWVNIGKEDIIRDSAFLDVETRVREDVYDMISGHKHRWMIYISKQTGSVELDLQLDCDLDTHLILKLTL